VVARAIDTEGGCLVPAAMQDEMIRMLTAEPGQAFVVPLVRVPICELGGGYVMYALRVSWPDGRRDW